jgi:hypothetical protein
MKGQSSIWYFLESFCISALAVNVSIALTTGVLTAPVPSASTAGAAAAATGAGPGAAPGGDGGAAAAAAGGRRPRRSEDGGDGPSGVGGALSVANEVQRQIVRGMLNRLSGTTGMQLINVNNVGIQLGGLDLNNRLVNQVGRPEGTGCRQRPQATWEAWRAPRACVDRALTAHPATTPFSPRSASPACWYATTRGPAWRRHARCSAARARGCCRSRAPSCGPASGEARAPTQGTHGQTTMAQLCSRARLPTAVSPRGRASLLMFLSTTPHPPHPPHPPASSTWRPRSRRASARRCSCRRRWATCPSRSSPSWSACQRASCRCGVRARCTRVLEASARTGVLPPSAGEWPAKPSSGPDRGPEPPSPTGAGPDGGGACGAPGPAVGPRPASALPADATDRGRRVLPGAGGEAGRRQTRGTGRNPLFFPCD